MAQVRAAFCIYMRYYSDTHDALRRFREIKVTPEGSVGDNMPPSRTPEYVACLINELRGLASETEWAEFKVSNSDPQTIGENISALSNGAALNGKTSAYIVWGIEDSTHNVVGTDFQPATAKRGNEPLENWLLRLLNPQIAFHFHETRVGDKRVVLLEIEPTTHSPVAFSGVEYTFAWAARQRDSGSIPRRRARCGVSSIWRVLRVEWLSSE